MVAAIFVLLAMTFGVAPWFVGLLAWERYHARRFPAEPSDQDGPLTAVVIGLGLLFLTAWAVMPSGGLAVVFTVMTILIIVLAILVGSDDPSEPRSHR